MSIYSSSPISFTPGRKGRCYSGSIFNHYAWRHMIEHAYLREKVGGRGKVRG